jgi:Uma2 family endonuclease
MAAETTEWTADLVRALPPDRNRYEVLDGELFVTPAPSGPHQRAVGELHLLLGPYTRDHAIGETWLAPTDLEFNPRRMLEPDLFVVELVDGKRTMSGVLMPRRLLLTVEVLSPSTQRADRVRKRAIYMEEGVPEYWIVDLDGRLIERWRQGDERPEIVTESLSWQPVVGVPALRLDLQAFFAGLWD